MPPNTTQTTEKYTRNRKILSIFAVIGLIFFIVIAIVLAIFDSRKTARLNILISPSFATVKIDNHIFKTEDDIRYFPGTYTAEISAEGFIPQSIPIELIANQEEHLYIALVPTPENSDYYEQNPRESGRLQAVIDSDYDAGSATYLAQYPIISIIPYEHSTEDRFGDPAGYRIDYGKFDDCDSDFCLQVTGYLKSNLEEAKEYIKSKGFNPDDYQILFNYTPVEKAKPEDFPESIRKIMEETGYFDN